MATEFQKKSFTFTWRLVNYKLLSKKIDIKGPYFLVDTLETSSWALSIYPDSSQCKSLLTVNISRNSDAGFAIELNYCFSVYSDQCSSELFEVSSSHKFQVNANILSLNVPKDKIFKRQNEGFLMPNVLIIQWKIWKKTGSLSEDGECTAITKIPIERMSFVGVVEGFSALTPDSKKAIRIRTASDERPQFSMNILVSKLGKIFIELTPLKYENIHKCYCVLYLIDSTGNKKQCATEVAKFYCQKTDAVWEFPLQVSKKYLLQDQYLMNDCLSLQCQIEFSTGRPIIKIIETRYATTLPKNNENSIYNLQNTTDKCGMLTVKDYLISLLSSGMLSDVKLQTATESFPAHKIMLSARSPVFAAMFQSDMKEKIKDCVEIDDLDADTVRNMLLFLYSDTLKDIDMESAIKLYAAADKYEILPLKLRCSSFLQDNFLTSNCCDVLMLADRHSDTNLRRAAQEFITQHDKDVLQSDKWKYLEETNLLLCYETLRVAH